VVAWAALLFVLSSIPTAGSGGGVTLKGAVLHLVAYAVLAMLLARAGTSRAVAVAAATVYGLTDELHQAFVPGRDAALADVGFDLLGAVCGVVIAWSFARGKE
jgi:VanZ family protein